MRAASPTLPRSNPSTTAHTEWRSAAAVVISNAVIGFSRRALLKVLLTPAVKVFDGADGRGNCIPRLMRVNVPMVGLDRRLDGLRIGQISDTHIGAALGLDH